MNKIILSFLLATFGLSLSVSAMKFPGKGRRLDGKSSGMLTQTSKKLLSKFINVCSSMKNSRLASAMKQEAIKGIKLGGRYTVRFLACTAIFTLLYRSGIFFYATSAASGLLYDIIADVASGTAYGITPQAPSVVVRVFNRIGSFFA